jgi:endonuclease/exonuclease/phosphatase family metal-dependent hydrolase
VVLLVGALVERGREVVAELDELVRPGLDEVEVVPIALFGLVARGAVVSGEGGLGVLDQPLVLGGEESQLALDEIDETAAHGAYAASAVGLVIRTWNVYHGRTHPKTGRTYLERMVRLVSMDAPDVVALQEVPLWALGRLERWSGMRAIWAVAVPNLLGPVARFLTDLDPVRMKLTLAGQANAILLNSRFEVGRNETLVLNPDVPRLEWIRGGRQRRVCQAVEVEMDGRALTVANLHATNKAAVARVEAGMAADFLTPARQCILCGDFNVPAFPVPGFSPPIEGIDQILVRGVELDREPEPWPARRRHVEGRVLSDHAPVEAEVAWT